MSLVVKSSELQHFWGAEVYSRILTATPEEQINARLELLARPEGVNFNEHYEYYQNRTYKIEARNVRMIAERSGNNPATKIFLCLYADSKISQLSNGDCFWVAYTLYAAYDFSISDMQLWDVSLSYTTCS